MARPYLKPHEGAVFGFLTVLGEGVPISRGKYLVRTTTCRCYCGVVRDFRDGNLFSGNSKSCGCKAKEDRVTNSTKHGESRNNAERTPEYNCWSAIWHRCDKKTGHKDYAGRGITVCERWLSFENFLADMGRRPSSLHSIERKDVNGNYEPSNCIWATRIVQMNNKRTNRRLTIDGETKTLAQWSRISGIRAYTIHMRLKAGYSEKDAVWLPLMKRSGVRKDWNAIRRERRAKQKQEKLSAT